MDDLRTTMMRVREMRRSNEDISQEDAQWLLDTVEKVAISFRANWDTKAEGYKAHPLHDELTTL